jgi:annexin A9
LQDLLKSLQAALSGNLERIVVALLQPTAYFDAQELKTALKVPGEDTGWGVWGLRTPLREKDYLPGLCSFLRVDLAETPLVIPY